MSAFAGIDIGASYVKAVIIQDAALISFSVIKTSEKASVAAKRVLEDALQKVGSLSFEQIDYITITGKEKEYVLIGNEKKSEQICMALGASWLYPSCRTVIDIGAESCRAVKLDNDGRIRNFSQNNKCAAGTGTFLEMMAKVLEVRLEEMGKLSVKADKMESISSFCSVFAESEVISLVHSGKRREHIIAGLHEGISDKVLEVVSKIGLEKEICMIGGVAKNIGVVKILEEKIGFQLFIPDEPQIIGALGAALYAQGVKQKK